MTRQAAAQSDKPHGHRQPVGRPLLITRHVLNAFGGDVICASFCKRIKIRADVLVPYLTYQHVTEIYDDRRIEQYEVQSTGIKNFKFASFLEKELVLVPPQAVQEEFLKLAGPAVDQVQGLGTRNRNLRQTRDLLLPKLISGEVIVTAADAVSDDHEVARQEHALAKAAEAPAVYGTHRKEKGHA